MILAEAKETAKTINFLPESGLDTINVSAISSGRLSPKNKLSL